MVHTPHKIECKFLLLALLCLIAGCSQPKATVDESGKQTVRVQLNWLPDAQFGGYYEALLAGEYDRAGLNVEINIGGPDAAVLPKLAMNRVEFGLGNADQLLLARQEGANVVAVLAVMQDNPRCIMVHQSSGIDSFEQLKDITLAMGEGNAFAQYLKSNLPLEGVRIVNYSGNVAKFTVDDKFAQQGYVFSEPIVAEQRGSDPKVLMVSELGFNPYAGIVMTSQRLAEQRPDLVRRFVMATKKGWLSYLSSPERANTEIHRLNPEIDKASLTEAVIGLRQLCFASASDNLRRAADANSNPGTAAAPDFGKMTNERWSQLHRQLEELDLLRTTPTQFKPSSVFTNRFQQIGDSSKEPITN